MRLLVHNMLKSTVRGVTNGFPLEIRGEKVEEKEQEFDRELIKGMKDRIDWKALAKAAENLHLNLPVSKEEEEEEKIPEEKWEDEDFLKQIHHLIFEVHVIEGSLICPETGRIFPISNGIPNMLLHEDEV